MSRTLNNPHSCHVSFRRVVRLHIFSNAALKMFRFLDLPPEIRVIVYAEVVSAKSSKHFPPPNADMPAWYRHDLSLFLVSKQVYAEAKQVFRDTNNFVKVSTPWPTALDYIKTDGKVPVVAHGRRAQDFTNWHLLATIDLLDYTDRSAPSCINMVLCAEDLPAFTAFWRWSEFDNQNDLNHFLNLNIVLKNPWASGQELSRELQERLLLPFGIVRELKGFVLQGDINPSVKDRVARLQAVAEPTLEQCIEDGFKLEDEGNDLVTTGRLKEGLEKYRQSFAAILITVDGRQREVHSDRFFRRTIRHGQWQGRSGTCVRILLRCRLVANIVLTYLKMGDFQEAHFWGKRTILLFRQMVVSMQEDGEVAPPEPYWTDEMNDVHVLTGTSTRPTSSSSTASTRQSDAVLAGKPFLDDMALFAMLNGFPAASDIGKICYRTAMASRQLGKTGDVRSMIRAAHVLLPKDEVILAENKKLDVEAEEREFVRDEARWDPMDVDGQNYGEWSDAEYSD